jgi:capsular polysaccharide transport system ATP-binding protein
MIELRNVCKTYVLHGIKKTVANDISITFPTGSSVALLGRNGAGKTSLLRMIAGTMDPDSGTINTDGSISWPVGFSGSFHPDLSGAQNTKFIARSHGVDTVDLCDFVEYFAELGKHFHLPLRTYSSGMRSRFAFGVSMGIKFDTYLIDEVTSVGDAAFRAKSILVFNNRMQSSSAIFVSHSMSMVKDMCDAAAVIENGTLTYFDDVDDAIALHTENMEQPPSN